MLKTILALDSMNPTNFLQYSCWFRLQSHFLVKCGRDLKINFVRIFLLHSAKVILLYRNCVKKFLFIFSTFPSKHTFGVCRIYIDKGNWRPPKNISYKFPIIKTLLMASLWSSFPEEPQLKVLNLYCFILHVLK